MKNLFVNNQFEGFMVFSHKSNWKTILTFLEKTLGQNQFFFFFDSERGYHLKVFGTNIPKKHLDTIASYLVSLPVSEATVSEDPLFRNVPKNTLHPVKFIPQTINITYPDNLANDDYIVFLNNLSSVVIHALRYNDFFIEEKNRINFAIQLIFMALIKADKQKITSELAFNLPANSSRIEQNSPLLTFYNNVQQIEKEEKIEAWVKKWLTTSERFLQQNSLQVLVESITTTLEIKSFTAQLLYTTQAVLLH